MFVTRLKTLLVCLCPFGALTPAVGTDILGRAVLKTRFTFPLGLCKLSSFILDLVPFQQQHCAESSDLRAFFCLNLSGVNEQSPEPWISTCCSYTSYLALVLLETDQQTNKPGELNKSNLSSLLLLLCQYLKSLQALQKKITRTIKFTENDVKC